MLRQHFFGADSDEVRWLRTAVLRHHSFVQVWRACKTVGNMCNLIAMSYLSQGNLDVHFEATR